LGSPVNPEFIRWLKSESANDLAVYSQTQTWCSLPVPPPSLDNKKITAGFSSRGLSNNSVTLDWNHGSFQAGLMPLQGLDGRPAATLASFQPIKQTLTVVGSPQKNLARQGRWFLFMGLLLAAAAAWQFMAPFNRLLSAVDKIKTGSLNIDLPLNRPDEWGQLARSLQEMAGQIKDKERVSLILGKVVSPKIARNILEAKDLFALKGERREVTLLHADLRGFNALSENMAPPILVEALNQYFTLINEAVFKHEGMMDKFIGETALALWGAPFTHDDKELRAVQTALEIQESLKDFNISRIKKGHPPFTIGIGIHTGLVVSGNLGSDKRSDYTVIGDPLHIAARLCAMANPGQTVVSEETYQKIKGQVEARALNPIAVKGSLEPLKTYEIIEFV
jgi:class 3 adenylate cyclase